MSDDMQHAVITGGTGALGRALASALQSPGWSVVALGSRDLDVRNRAAVQEYFRQRKTNLLICAAGVTHDAPLVRLSENTWDETWHVNFKGAALCADAVLPGMLAENNGHIVFISSFSALHPPAGQAAYASAKAALLGLATELAARHGSSNIRVNAVLPGFLETKMTASVTDRRRTEILAAHTLGRLNTCHEAARFIRFLHHEMPHTSGQVFQLDSRPSP